MAKVIEIVKFLIKKCLGFVLGTLLAYGFYRGILIDLGIDSAVLKPLALMLCILLGLGCAFSEELQCVGLICVTMFFSRSGRRQMQAMVFAYLLAGPVANLIHNGHEVARSFGCSSELIFNLSSEYAQLTIAPFKRAIMGMKEDDADSVNSALKQMSQQLAPIRYELRGEDPEENKRLQEENDYVDRIQGNPLQSKDMEEKYDIQKDDTKGELVEKQYMESLETKCRGVISRSTERCRSSFESAYNSCEDKVSIFVSWLLCWPMKLTFVCDIITLMAGGNACNAEDNVEPGYGDAYSSLATADKTLGQDIGQATFHYQLPTPDVKLDVKNAAASVKEVMADVRVKLDSAQIILVAFRRLLALLFLPVILESVRYVNLYMSEPGHDNIYITSRFKSLDAKRKTAGRSPCLLPLRSEELEKLVNVRKPFPHGPESINIFGPYLKLGMLIMIAAVMLSIDDMLAHTLAIVTKHGKINIRQTGHHVVHITVKGSGFVAKIVRNMVQGFNEDVHINNVFNNEECLPHAHVLDEYYLSKMSLIFLGMAALVVLDHVPTRLRRIICSYFYPKFEKKRTLHLYNQLLKARFTWRERAKDKIKEKVKELQRQEAYSSLPQPLVHLTSCFIAKRCVLCGKKKNRSQVWLHCPTCPIGLSVCPGCWDDLGDQCPVCDPQEEEEEP